MINFLKSLVLLVLALVLFAVFTPIGIVFGLLQSIYRLNFDYFSKIILRSAVSIDQLGNTICGELLNYVFLSSRDKIYYMFGHEDDTVSEVLGRNAKVENLNIIGKLVGALLEKIDPGHLEKSFD